VGAITAPISGALSGLASGGPIGAAAGAGAGAVNGVGGLITSASDCRCIMKCGGIQGQLAMDLANIDAQVIEIQSMERATIEIKNGEIELARDEQEVKLLMLKQANLELNIRMAERDESREEMALSDILGEASTVASDMVRALSFARNDAQFGWNDSDVRDVLTNNALKANESFNRAQAWAFVALRALEYYADLPPDVSTGLPNQLIQNLYTELYQTRTAQNLRDLLTAMKINNDTSFVFSASTASCPGRGILSLKYDVVVPTLLMSNFDASGQPPDGAVEGESDYKYRDPQTGEILQGARAYQGAFREFLHRSLSGTRGNRILRLVFATDLYRRRSSGSADASNPFELDAVRAKITGFDVQDCGGVGTVPNVQGIQVDFTGNIPTASKAPALTVQQSGNSYVKHSKWVVDSITGKIKDPWKSLRVYSAYKQLLPVWLASDIDQSASEPMDGGSQMEIGSEVISEEFSPLLNGLNGGNLSTKTRAFTDRSVANDHWELVLKDTSDTYTEKFLDSVQAMLDKTVSDPASDDFLTDIELWIGWSYKGY